MNQTFRIVVVAAVIVVAAIAADAAVGAAAAGQWNLAAATGALSLLTLLQLRNVP